MCSDGYETWAGMFPMSVGDDHSDVLKCCLNILINFWCQVEKQFQYNFQVKNCGSCHGDFLEVLTVFYYIYDTLKYQKFKVNLWIASVWVHRLIKLILAKFYHDQVFLTASQDFKFWWCQGVLTLCAAVETNKLIVLTNSFVPDFLIGCA